MTSLPLWRVHAELPVPTIRPHDHQTRLQQALSSEGGVVWAEALIGGTTGRYHVAATVVVAATDAKSAAELAGQALQHACAIARLPTGPLRAIATEPVTGSPPG